MYGYNGLEPSLAEAGKVAVDSLTYKLVQWVITGIGAVAGGIVGAVPTIIAANADGNADKLPPFDPFAREATAAIEWPGSSGTKLQSVAFNGGLQVGVDPCFIE